MTGFGANEKENGRKNKRRKTIQLPGLPGEDSFKTAIQLHAKGDVAGAEKSYREAIRVGFNHHAIFLNLGVICKDSGRIDEAIYLYKRATQINPDYPHAYTNLGDIYKDLGNLNEALACTLKSLELKSDNPDALMNLGGIYQDLGNLDQALNSTLKSLSSNLITPHSRTRAASTKTLAILIELLLPFLNLELKPDTPDAS